MTIEEVIAHVEIRHVLSKYVRAGDRHDIELANSVYWPEAHIKHAHVDAGVEYIDRAAKKHKEEALPGVACHHITGQYIKIDDADHARVESCCFAIWPYFDENHVEHTGAFSGRYLDKFERRNGEWRIIERLVVHDFSRADFPGEIWPITSRFIQGTGNDQDPSFEFFK